MGSIWVYAETRYERLRDTVEVRTQKSIKENLKLYKFMFQFQRPTDKFFYFKKNTLKNQFQIKERMKQ